MINCDKKFAVLCEYNVKMFVCKNLMSFGYCLFRDSVGTESCGCILLKHILIVNFTVFLFKAKFEFAFDFKISFYI